MNQVTSYFKKAAAHSVIAAQAAAITLSIGPDALAEGNHRTKPAPAIKKKTVNKVTYQRSSSEESRAERDRRLDRECRGLPNAGACLGYARSR